MIPRVNLVDNYSISSVIKGGWHLAGGHGAVDQGQAMEDMLAYVKAGVTTFDCADIYTGVEELIGQFLTKHKTLIHSGEIPEVQIHTKYVPDHNALSSLTFEDTSNIIARSLTRLNVERLDLVQYCWWDFSIPGWIDTALDLMKLKDQGKIRYLGVTNIDGKNLEELKAAGVEVISNQVQYSVLDERPATDLEANSEVSAIPLLCYGVLAGGYLSDRFLTGEAIDFQENRSLTKYELIIDEFGGPQLYRDLLNVLKTIADKYEVTVSDIAMKYILSKKSVAAAIIGVRNQNHLAALGRLFQFELDNDDYRLISDLQDRSKGPNGVVFGLERDKEGRHGRIMKYNLNGQRP